MKRVLLSTKVLHAEDLNDTHLIGVEVKTFNEAVRGQLIKVSKNNYIVVEIGKSNDFLGGLVQESSIQLLIRRLEPTITKLYVFDDSEELIDWLIKK